MAETRITEKDFRSVVQKAADAYIPLVEKALSGTGISTDAYQHQCMANALIAMDDAAAAAGQESLAVFDKKEIMAALQQVATLRLNVFAQPRECYFVTRKKKLSDGSWGLSIEMGVEGDLSLIHILQTLPMRTPMPARGLLVHRMHCPCRPRVPMQMRRKTQTMIFRKCAAAASVRLAQTKTASHHAG